jgi:hypothetical protein
MGNLVKAVLCLCCCLFMAACGNGGSSKPLDPPPPAPTISVQLSATSLQVGHAGTAAETTATVAATGGSNAITVSVSGAPGGVTTTIQQPTEAQPAKLSFVVTNASQAQARKYTLTVSATNGKASGSAQLTLDVAAQASIAGAATGAAAPFMSTSFQVATWSYAWLQNHPAALTPLGDLGAQHIRLQILNNVAPQISANQWDFSKMDAMVQPVLTVGDKSPQFQIANAPAFMYDSNGNFRDATYAEFAEYCANLVRYYNKGGFTVNGVTYRSPANVPITWWGIYNEPNINQPLTSSPAEYVKLYNAVAKSMLAVDPSIKLVALELSDWGDEPQRYLPPFLAGMAAPVHAFGTHYYGTCQQTDKDTALFGAVDYFASHVRYYRSTLDANNATNGLPIWVNENNVNADYNNNGKSACNSSINFVVDPRGSSAFFAAWRPYVYSQLTKAGMWGLWHWAFAGDVQYGEVDDNGNKRLSYWVDYYLSHLFTGSDTYVIPMTTTEPAGVEAFGVLRSDGSRVLMVVNRDIASTNDNNGPGVPKTVTLDLSSLGNYTSASLLAIDATTNATNGPVSQALTPAPKLTLSFPGYGVQFVTVR